MGRAPKLRPGDASRESAENDERPSSRALTRRASFRPEIRGALALEEAGELNEAARVFEYAGEHGPAAALRLEYADTLHDEAMRIRVLREGAARNPGNTREGRALHLALAEALLRAADALERGARQRSLRLEAARALDEADQCERAGELYEELGLLTRAARSFERAGALSQLELVLEVLDRRERAEAALASLEREVEHAWREGRRHDAHALLSEHVREQDHLGRLPRRNLAALLDKLESSRPRPERIDLRWSGGDVTHVRMGPRFTIGRAPEVDLTVSGAELSRAQVELRMQGDDDGAALVAVDLGSRAGTFWRDDPLTPGEPTAIERADRLGLGFSASIEVAPVHGPGNAGPCGALLRPAGADAWWLFLPGGGPLTYAPDRAVGASVTVDDGYVVLTMEASTSAWLGREPLGPGARIELLLGDRVRLRNADGSELEAEVIA